LEVSAFFNGNDNKVYDFFKHDLFDDWVGVNFDEWAKMDKYIIDCVQAYLRDGLIQQEFVSLAEKEFMVECGEEFIQFLDEFSESGYFVVNTFTDKGLQHFTRKSLRKAFIDYLFENRYKTDYYARLSANEIYRRLQVWSNFREFRIIEVKKAGQRSFSVRNKEIIEKSLKNVHG